MTSITPVSWTTKEFEEKEKHPDWQWYAGLVALIVAIISFFTGNIFFGIFAILAGAMVIIYAHRKPELLTITIDDGGVHVNETLFGNKQLKEFWLDETAKPDKLLLRVTGTFIPVHAFNLEGVSADTVRTALLSKDVAEVEMRESSGVAIFDRLGF